MKTLINILLVAFFMGTTAVIAQVAPEPPAPPVGGALTMPPAPPAPPAPGDDLDHSKNYSITLRSSDSESGEDIYLSLKNKQDRYLANGRFPNRFRSDMLAYITSEMGGDNKISKPNFDEWIGGSEEDAIYKITLKEDKVIISLDKQIASNTLINKIGDLGVGIKRILADEDQEVEIERLERDADRLRRDAARMQREADRIRQQAERDADRLMRDANRVMQEADRQGDRAMQDADRLARQADLLAREVDKASMLSAKKGGMDSTIREVLNKPSTFYNTSNAQNRNGWTFPALYQDLMLSLEGDGVLQSTSNKEIVFVYDASGMYINGTQLTDELEDAYQDLFKRHGIKNAAHFKIYKIRDNVAMINSNARIEDFFKALLAQGEISSLKKPLQLDINGDSVSLDGTKLSDAKLKKYNDLLAAHNIMPMPGKMISIIKKDGYKLGYSLGKNTHIGTWIMNF